MYNKIILMGNLTRDVELTFLTSGAIGKTGIATSRQYTDKNSREKKKEVTFVDLVFWGRTAEVASQYLKKGSKLLVEGRLELSQWVTPDGVKRSKHSVVVESMQMLSSVGSGSNASPQGGEYNNSQNSIEQGGIDMDGYSPDVEPQKENTYVPATPKKTTLDDFPPIDENDEIPF